VHVQALDELTPEEQSAPGYLAVTLDTLERTNLIAKTYMSSNYPEDPPTDIMAPVFHSYVVTDLGMMFVRACRAPAAANAPTKTHPAERARFSAE
jgi:hypothetical protein